MPPAPDAPPPSLPLALPLAIAIALVALLLFPGLLPEGQAGSGTPASQNPGVSDPAR